MRRRTLSHFIPLHHGRVGFSIRIDHNPPFEEKDIIELTRDNLGWIQSLNDVLWNKRGGRV